MFQTERSSGVKIAYPLPNAVTLIDPDYRAMHSLTQKTVTSQEHIVAVDLTDWCELIWTSAKTIEEGVQEWGGKIAAALEVMHSETDGEQE
jgi:hypothetical protein